VNIISIREGRKRGEARRGEERRGEERRGEARRGEERRGEEMYWVVPWRGVPLNVPWCNMYA